MLELRYNKEVDEIRRKSNGEIYDLEKYVK